LVGECANGHQAVAAIRALQPDLLWPPSRLKIQTRKQTMEQTKQQRSTTAIEIPSRLSAATQVAAR
jgi:hypothetical protein